MTTPDDEHLDIPGGLEAALPTSEPPPGFADRVLAARQAVTPAAPVAPPAIRRHSSPLRRWLLVATVMFAVGGALLLTRRGPAPRELRGELLATERQAVPLGRRAVAVAEPGADLAWTVSPNGDARITQRDGIAFYRVDRQSGRAFQVATPAGDVHVTGTCFRVEVDMNAKKLAVVSGAAGAALSAVVLVAVYEGRVKVKNAHGEIDVGPGESVQLGADRAPGPTGPDDRIARTPGPGPGQDAVAVDGPPAADVTRDQLLARDAKHRDQLAALNARIRALEQEREAGPRVVKRGPGEGDLDRKMHGFTAEEWEDMASRCEIRFDLPPLGVETRAIGKRALEEAGLNAEQGEQIAAVVKAVGDAHVKELRALYIEATGDTAGAETLNPHAMATEILQKSGDDGAARRRVGLERAGKLQPPADPATSPIAERYFRLVLHTGDLLESELAKIVGPEVAKQLRDQIAGNRSIMAGCHEDDEAERAPR